VEAHQSREARAPSSKIRACGDDGTKGRKKKRKKPSYREVEACESTVRDTDR